jgi:alpha-tubulin suppressor-like RCC1 family protein
MGIDGLTQVVAAYCTSAGLRNDGSVWVWGDGSQGQLGNGSNDSSLLPSEATITAVGLLAAGHRHFLAAKTSGLLFGWGNNDNCQLGNGATQILTPTAVIGLANVTDLAGGEKHSLAVSGGKAYAWGANTEGQIGNGGGGPGARVCSPTEVSALSSIGSAVRAVAAGDAHSLALLQDGRVFSWGRNRFGQLGDGTIDGQRLPVAVKDAAGTGFLTGIVAIAANGGNSLALSGTGEVWWWGFDIDPDPTKPDESPLPRQIIPLGPASRITSGRGFSLALLNDSVWGWWANFVGQLGDGSTVTRQAPVAARVDETPGDLGNLLTAVVDVNGLDVRLDFPLAPAAHYQLHADPSKTTMGMTPLGAPQEGNSYVDPGAVARAGDIYYYLRGLSLCSFDPGP